jgi:hypothetical protein
MRYLKIIMCVVLTGLILPQFVIAQQIETLEMFLEGFENSKFEDLQEKVNEFYKLYPDKRLEKKWRRHERYLMPRVWGMEGPVDIGERTQEAFYTLQRELGNSRTTHGDWSYLGHDVSQKVSQPNWGQGRVNSIDFHPVDQSTIYVCTASGGIWKTTNDGNTWQNLTSRLPYLSFIDLEIDYNNPNNIYALTGDGEINFISETSHYQTGAKSSGILISTDGGITWSLAPFAFTTDVYPRKLKMHPTNPQIQFAVTTEGTYRTENGWSSGSEITPLVTYDLEFHPGEEMIVYGSGSKKIMKSIDGGLSFPVQVVDPDMTFSDCARIELAVTPDFPTLIYAQGACRPTLTKYLTRIYASYLEGASNTWAVKDTLSDLVGPFMVYANAIQVNPNNYSEVYAGGIATFKSSSEATMPWTSMLKANVHPDIHDIQFHNGAVYFATDGGLHKSSNGGSSFTDLSSGLGISEVYRITGTPADPNKYITGAQDVGHHYRLSNSTSFKSIGDADGMFSLINYLNSNIIYVAGQYGGLRKSYDAGSSFVGVAPPGDAGAWVTPFIMDRLNPDVIFFAKDSVHRSDTGASSWKYLGNPMNSNINNIHQARLDRNTLFVSRDRQMFVTYDALITSGVPAWIYITPPEIDRFITEIATSSYDPDILYLSLGGYMTGGIKKKVYKGTKFSAGNYSWENISGNLPDLPILTISVAAEGQNQDGLYVGTDIGVFYKNDSMNDWIYFSNYLPIAPVSDIYINPTDNSIAAGLYGRGLWKSPLYSGCTTNLTIAGGSFPIDGTFHYSASNSILSNRSYSNYPGTDINYKAGNYIDLVPGFLAKSKMIFEAKIGPCH